MISTCLANNSRSPCGNGGSGLGGNTLRARHVIAAGAAVTASVLMTAACSSSSSTTAASSAGTSGSSSSSSASAASNINFNTCDSITACGGMSALVAAAKKEGQLN